MNYKDLLQGNIGKKVFVKRKSTPQYTIVGTLTEFDDEKVFISSERDTYLVDYADVLSLDIKNSTPYIHYQE